MIPVSAQRILISLLKKPMHREALKEDTGLSNVGLDNGILWLLQRDLITEKIEKVVKNRNITRIKILTLTEKGETIAKKLHEIKEIIGEN